MDTPQAKPDLLIVDDDPLITDTLNFALGRDFSVRAADSRAQVLSLLRQLDHPPQLALIDLGLPPTPHRPDEGFKLINELIAYSPGIKILVLSGQEDETNARHARALGAIEFIAKPCEPAKIKALRAAQHPHYGQPGLQRVGQRVLRSRDDGCRHRSPGSSLDDLRTQR